MERKTESQGPNSVMNRGRQTRKCLQGGRGQVRALDGMSWKALGTVRARGEESDVVWKGRWGPNKTSRLPLLALL